MGQKKDEKEEEELGEDKTIVDEMFECVQKRGKTSVDEVARALGLEKPQVEKIAEILEESDLIAIHYSLLHPGKTELIAKKVAASKASSALNRIKADSEAFHKLISVVDKQVEGTEGVFLQIERDVFDTLTRAEQELVELEEKEGGASEEDIEYILEQICGLERVLATFKGKVRMLEDRLNSFDKNVRMFESKTRHHGKASLFSKLSASIRNLKDRLSRKKA